MTDAGSGMTGLPPIPTPLTSAEERGHSNLTKFAWLSIAAAVATIGLKFAAFLITGSVGLLSDAAESVVNLVAAIVALVALRVADRPPDENHHYGHGKAEYFSAFLEGVMIFVAAAVIIFSAVNRFLHPQELEGLGLGLAISTGATAINLVVGQILIRQGRAHRSPTLVADGKHLMTDVWTSVGVIVGVLAVGLTGWLRLDPLIAAAVGVNILVTGYRLVSHSITQLLDAALPQADVARILEVLDGYRSADVSFHALQTRESGRQRFASVHVLVPGEWTVQRGHDLLERIEGSLREALPGMSVSTHLEPVEDPVSYEDIPAGVPPLAEGRPPAG